MAIHRQPKGPTSRQPGLHAYRTVESTTSDERALNSDVPSLASSATESTQTIGNTTHLSPSGRADQVFTWEDYNQALERSDRTVQRLVATIVSLDEELDRTRQQLAAERALR